MAFLSKAQRQRYGCYVEEPTPAQLACYFHLDDRDQDLVNRRRGDHNRLGFAIQLCTVRFLGTFLVDPIEVPSIVVAHIAPQLGISDVSCLPRYLDRPGTHWEHANQIQQHYDYLAFNEQPIHWQCVRWLYGRAWIGDESPSVLFDATTVWLIERKVLLPGVTVLERLVMQVRERATRRAWRQLAQRLDPDQETRLTALLAPSEEAWYRPLEQLRRSPTRHSAPALVIALKRLIQIRDLGVSHLSLTQIPPSRIKALSRIALTVRAQTIEKMPFERKMATLLAFAKEIEATAQDEILDVLEGLVKELLAKSARDGKKERLRTLKDLDKAALLLSQVCSLLLEADDENVPVRETVFEQVPEQTLAEAIAKVEALARPADDQYYPEVLARWRTVRQFLPLLLETVDFQATKSGRSILAAVQFLTSIEGKQKPKMDNAPQSMITKGWSRWVNLPAGDIDRRAYTFCVLEQLMAGLRRRDLFVSPSVRWSNPQDKLLQGSDWEAARLQVCRTLNLAPKPEQELTKLSEQLEAAYRRTAANLDSNPAVRIEQSNGQDTLTISHLDKLEEPHSLIDLREKVAALLPRVDLTEIILEIHARTGFLDDFTHANEGESRVQDLATSLCAVLTASACNIGLRPLQHRQDNPALTGHRLNWVKQNYIRPETLTLANARLVDAQTQIPLAQQWGGGDVASADGMRFVVPVRTLNAGPNPKYFNQGRGVTYYNFTSSQFTGFHALVVPGTLRDSLVVLVGLLEQRTSLRPQELMTDTAGYSDIIFGLFWLLGYQFSPRLADAGEARFWRIDSEADYGLLNGLARQQVKTKLIEEQWDDMLRIAGSLKQGTVSALEIMRVLQRGGNPSALGKAIAEAGRVSKTLYLLNYVDDENYRRRILTQLNRGESRHSLARAVFHGQRGELRQRYREGQEDQLGALGLVVNVIVLWNTLYMESALQHLQQQGLEVRLEDRERLSPLGHIHINMLGRFFFDLPESVQLGAMRSLRSISDFNERFA
jgi:TnpA family transposase